MARSVMINHPNHHHVLMLESAVKAPFNCDGCKELGFGSSYECKQCNFHLHVECATMLPHPPAVHHPFCKGCEFVFRKESGEYYDRSPSSCEACGRVVLGFSYLCRHKKAYHLHPCCLSLPQILTGDNGIRLRLTKKVSSKCVRCKSKKTTNGIKGWSYVADCDGSCYHVACVKDMILEKFQTASSNYPVVPISTSTALARRSDSSFLKRFFKKVPKKLIVIKLIVSAITGDPTGLIGAIFSLGN